MFDDPITRHIHQDVGDEEDQEGDVEFVTRFDAKIFGQAVDFGVSNIRAIYEGEEPAEVSF